MKTGIIRYNIHDRGRNYTGKRRNFDAASVAAIVNSDKIQERVRNRDMVGYLGHWPRVKYGLQPPESIIDSGKFVVLTPAFVTTHLKMDDQGNMEHEADTLDNVPGNSIDTAIASKQGGFSSVIDTRNQGGKHVAVAMYGFDYVRDPNYTANRPYGLMLDSADDEDGEDLQTAFDDAVGEYSAALVQAHTLNEILAADHRAALELITRLTAENNDLIGRVASGGVQLDSTEGFVRPLRTRNADAVLAGLESFRGAQLVALDSAGDEQTERNLERTREAALSRLRR